MPKGRKLLGWSVALCSQLWAAAAFAQTTPPAGTADTTVAAPTTKLGEEITITGSRIRRKDLTTPAPVTVLSREQVQASGKVSLGDFLQSLPEQGNAINTAVNNGGDGSTRINLRNLGTARTLVLLNGRRMVPGGTGADASVDLNSIPTSAIERIEVLKDGASAVYGSDAIGGVVNVITRKRFDGAEVNAFYGQSTHGDGKTYDINGTVGTAGDTGSLMFGVGYYKQETVWAGDRDWSNKPLAFDMTGENNPFGNPPGEYTIGSGTVPAGSFSIPSSAKGKVVANPGNDPRIALYNNIVGTYPTKTKFVFDPTSPLGWRPFVSFALPSEGGDAYNFQPANYLVTPQQRISLFSTGDHKLGNFARAYYEASYVNRTSQIRLAAEPFTGGAYDYDTTVSKDSMYNPFGVDIVSTNRRLVEFGNRVHDIEVSTFRIVAGIDGTLPDTAGPVRGWFWDVALNFGRTGASDVHRGSLLLPNITQALGPSFLDPATGPTCGTPASPIAGCVPLNLFGGAGTITPDMQRNLTYAGTNYGSNQMMQVTANTSGEVFTLPTSDRPIGLALGYEFRRLLGSYTPDPIAAQSWSTDNAAAPVSGGYDAHEFYGELSLPLVSHMPFAEAIEATAAARVFHYNTFGTDYTYKFGLRWTPVRDVTLRGTYSTAYRAPSIGELYSGQSDNFANVSDPCSGPVGTVPASCGAAAGNGDDRTQIRSKVGGNPNLKPETAKIYTAGVVLEPRWVKGLTFTADYYNTEVTDSVQSIGEALILQNCYPAAGVTPKNCDLVQRDPITQQITRIVNLQANLGGVKTSGVDFAVRYQLPTQDFGRFMFMFDATWLRNFDITQADGSILTARGNFDYATQSNGGSYGVLPAWRFNTGVIWGLGGLSAGGNLRFVGSFKECGDPAGDFAGSGVCFADNTYQRQVSAWTSIDAFVSYAIKTAYGRTTIGAGVNNLFDKAPSRIYNGFTAASDPSAYDFMGRFVYLRVSQSI